MTDCEKYLELISAHIDGELSESEKADLENHLSVCPSCRNILPMLRSVSGELSDNMTEPPASLLENVMAGVRADMGYPLAGDSNKHKAKKKRRLIISRYVSAAACVALIVFVAPSLAHLGCGASGGDAAPRYATSSADKPYFSESLTSAPEAYADSATGSEPDGVEDADMMQSNTTVPSTSTGPLVGNSERDPQDSYDGDPDTWKSAPQTAWPDVSETLASGGYATVIRVAGDGIPAYFADCVTALSDDGAMRYAVLPLTVADDFIRQYYSGTLELDESAVVEFEYFETSSELALLLVK